MQRTERIIIRLSPQEREMLTQLAQRMQQTASATVRELVQKALMERER